MGRKKKKSNREDGVSKAMTEETRIRISKLLEDFRASPHQVFTFPPGMKNYERANIHSLCKEKGFASKSSGRSDNRTLSVYKCKKKKQIPFKLQNATATATATAIAAATAPATFLNFSDDARVILRNLFTQFPPTEAELAEKPTENSHIKHVNLPRNQDGCFRKPSMSRTEITKMFERFTLKLNDSNHLQKITEARAKLPIFSFKDTITSTVNSNQVVLISGETGCGKTTQVPQYILDDVWAKGESCKIICTQPRRISAISVAERISYERGENVGDTVGYKIRLESQGGRQSSVMFCTNGILLRILLGRVNISKTETTSSSVADEILEISHIIMDEIHERDRFSDFNLAILRDLLVLYPHLRLILMSATMDSDRFSQYFNGCPIIRVPGFTYPVKSFYLEDVLSFLVTSKENHLDGSFLNGSLESAELTEDYKSLLDQYIDLALKDDEIDSLVDLISSDSVPNIVNYQHSSTGVSPLMVFAGKGRIDETRRLLSFGANCYLSANDGTTVLDYAQRIGHDKILEMINEHMKEDTSKTTTKNDLLAKYMASNNNPVNVDTNLIVSLLRKICTDSQEGAILVFLPGWDDIRQTRDKLLLSSLFKDSSKFLILCLHSMVPSAEQKKVFERPKAGSRKIILSTNIAETAVTIDDVVYVIDSGRMKEKNYDPYSNVSTLYSSWVSKANAKQREGRAGRCQSGVCYHLFSIAHKESLPEHQVPEIKRIPIEELCLQVKLLDSNYEIKDFLQKTLDPPVNEAIHNAVALLQDIGALTIDEKLTELGEKLGVLPVHPLTSKMLFFAILMNCLDPALTLACAADYKDPFVMPMVPEERKKAAAAKLELTSVYGGYSDHLTIIALFDYWKHAKENGFERKFCSKYFVSSGTMKMLSNMRKQLLNDLIRHGFVPQDTSRCSLNSKNRGILRAILLAGTYPNVGKMLSPVNNSRRALVETVGGTKVTVHPHSSNFKLAFNKCARGLLITYDEITRGEGGMISMKTTSVVSPYPLLLVATEMAVVPADNPEDGIHKDGEKMSDCDEKIDSTGQKIMSSPEKNVSIVVDRWLKFESPALDVAQIYCLRHRLSAAILFKVKYPCKILPQSLGASIYAIACILSNDGMFGISPPLEHIGLVNNVPGQVQNLDDSQGSFPVGKTQHSRRFRRHKEALVSDAMFVLSPPLQHIGLVNNAPGQVQNLDDSQRSFPVGKKKHSRRFRRHKAAMVSDAMFVLSPPLEHIGLVNDAPGQVQNLDDSQTSFPVGKKRHSRRFRRHKAAMVSESVGNKPSQNVKSGVRPGQVVNPGPVPVRKKSFKRPRANV